MAAKPIKLGLLDKVFVGLLLIIFGGIILHAPLSVGFSALFPQAELLIKAWKEILILVATVFAAIIVTRRKQWAVMRHPVILLILGYVLLHIALVPLFYQGATVTFAGLGIDLRYVAYFSLVYVAIRLYPAMRRPFIATFIGGALIVAAFSILQVTVLPKDILSHIGYGQSSIQPYLLLDENPDYVRINSTLRGPNSLGAYAVIVLSLLAAFWLKGNHKAIKRPMVPVAIIGIGSLVALWFSFSRSALIGFVVAIGLAIVIGVPQRVRRKIILFGGLAIVIAGLGLFLAKDSSFVANIILHDNPTTGAEMTSNQGHADSLHDGVNRMVHQPLGGGIGSTGSASLLGDSPLIIENQYLFIAHEAGWLGLGLFIVILWKVFLELWRRRADWLALGVFASGVGILIIALLLPIWVDDTVAIIWWGLAALALGGTYGTLNKKTKRTA